jgi:putative adhesin
MEGALRRPFAFPGPGNQITSRPVGLVGSLGVSMKRYIARFVVTFVIGVVVVAWVRDARLGVPEQTGDNFAWRGTMAPGGPVLIRNLFGDVTVETGAGDSVEILAEKRWRHNEPQSVQIQVLPSGNGYTACALWRAQRAICEPGGEYEHSNRERSDVRVSFTVRVPPRSRVDVSTYSGEITVRGRFGATVARTQSGDIAVSEVSGPVQATTRNGDIDVETRSGPVTAETVSGDVTAVIHTLGAAGDISLKTRSGDVEVKLPEVLNAEVSATTVNGRVETEYPVTMTGRINSRSLQATIGRGGRKIGLETVNGSIVIGKVDSPEP